MRVFQMGVTLSVPCFVSGCEIIIQDVKPRITKHGGRWDRDDDSTLVHWVNVEKLSITEIINKCDWSGVTVRKQLKRLGL